jgi:uncharacterized protein (TIGR02186 family)
MKNFFLFLFVFVIFNMTPSHKSSANTPLVTDISSHLISVTSDFTGTELLLFGATETGADLNYSEHGDVIIVVRGPEEKVVVRRKDRIAGIWVNAESIEFTRVPSFYAIVSTKPVADITSANVLNRLKIGPTRLSFISSEAAEESQPFQQAIIRKKTEANLYSDQETDIHFLGNTLFRTNIEFPANVPVGNYVAEFYLFRAGDLISAQTSPLFIKKSGLGRTIFDFAQDYPALYGIAAILVALFAGWLASAIFRKD